MRRFAYRACLALIAVATLGTLAVLLWGAGTLSQELAAAGFGEEAVLGAVAAKVLLDLVVWALIVVPLGLIALVLRPARRHAAPEAAPEADPAGLRREPHF